MQKTNRTYQVLFIFLRYSTRLVLLHFDTFAKKLPSSFRLKYFSAYVHVDVVKSSEFSSMHEDVKFISLFGVASQKLDMRVMYIKTIIKNYYYYYYTAGNAPYVSSFNNESQARTPVFHLDSGYLGGK
jgi:hypothetical protein